MGIWTDQFIAPYEAHLLDVAEFADLAAGLIAYGVACAPWTLVAGNLSANAELPYVGILGDIRWSIRDGSLTAGGVRVTDTAASIEWDDRRPPWGQVMESGRVLATGTDPQQIGPALAAAPYGQEDIAIVFDRLDFTNAEVLKHFWSADSRIQLTCFALARPQLRPVSANTLADPGDGPVHPVQTFLSIGYKHGESGYPCPPVADALVRTVGPGLVIGQTMG